MEENDLKEYVMETELMGEEIENYIFQNQSKKLSGKYCASQLPQDPKHFTDKKGVEMDPSQNLKEGESWAIVRGEETDEEGWKYAESFTSKLWTNKDSPTTLKRRRKLVLRKKQLSDSASYNGVPQGNGQNNTSSSSPSKSFQFNPINWIFGGKETLDFKQIFCETFPI